MIPPGENVRMTHAIEHQKTAPELLSFAEAGRLTGKPKAYLKELAESGLISVRIQPGDGASRIRLTRAGLIEAGLLQEPPALVVPERTELGELIALVREQSARISSLEEQRFQLGTQLGAAIERVCSLESRVSAQAPVRSGDGPENVARTVDATLSPASVVHSLLEIGGKSVRRSAGLRTRFARSRFWPTGRSEAGSAD